MVTSALPRSSATSIGSVSGHAVGSAKAPEAVKCMGSTTYNAYPTKIIASR